MDKLEKVIKGFECCGGPAIYLGHCPEECPYFSESERADKCVEKLHADALELLREKEPLKAKWRPVPFPIWTCRNCGMKISHEKQDKYCSYCGRKIKWE